MGPVPKVVDHDQRRREVAAAAAHSIARNGLEATTVREVSRIAGYSTTVVSHYFADKRELLEFTYQESANLAYERIEHALEQDPGNVREAAYSLLPIGDENIANWRVWFAYWGAASLDESLAAEQRRRVILTRERLREAFVHSGLNEDEAERRARTLLALLMGVAAQAVFDPTDWNADRMRSEIDSVLVLDAA